MNMARQMHCRRPAFGENQPLRINPPCLRLGTQRGLCPAIGRQNPQHRSFCLPQKTHPDVKLSGRDLVAVVKAAIDKPILGQRQIRPRWSHANGATIVRHQIRPRHPHHSFGIGSLGTFVSHLGISRHLEPVGIMDLEKRRHRMHRRMVVKIRREISQPDPIRWWRGGQGAATCPHFLRAKCSVRARSRAALSLSTKNGKGGTF